MKMISIIRRDVAVNTHSRIKRLSLVVAVLLPLAYGFLYLWAFWDPYENMEDVPVAVVNADIGSEYDGKQQNIGQRITDELEDNKVLDWEFTSQEEAEEGLDSQRYYAIIFIPQSFSSDLTSAGSDSPRQAVISWKTRDSTNFLFTTYFKNVIAALGKKINQGILPEFSQAAEVRIREATGRLDEAADGAQRLSKGIGNAENGSKTLEENIKKAGMGSDEITDGLSKLDSSSYALNDGMRRAEAGSASLSAGLASADSGAKSLGNGLTDLSDGADRLKDGSEQLEDGTRELASGAGNLDSKVKSADEALSPWYPLFGEISKMISTVNSIYPVPVPDYIAAASKQKDALLDGTQKISDGSEKIAEGMSGLDEGIGALDTGIKTAESGADSLSDGIAGLNEGSKELNRGIIDIADGTERYTGGVGSAYAGSKELSSGLSQLADGSSQLTSGLGDTKSGAETLSSGINSGKEEIKQELSDSKIETLMSVINEPIIFKDTSTAKNSTYGAGFAPYFIPLSLWMGALILTLLIPTRDPKLSIAGISRFTATSGKFFLLAIIGMAQALTLSLAILYGLGLEASNPAGFILFCILISLTFISIMQLLSFCFGKIGELIGIILLMIQLTSASGTFPVESAPRFFQVMNPLVPMTYAIRGLRLLILGGDMAIVMKQATILGAFAITFLSAKALATRKTVKTTDIYPLIEL